jgi:hypothetical protein
MLDQYQILKISYDEDGNRTMTSSYLNMQDAHFTAVAHDSSDNIALLIANNPDLPKCFIYDDTNKVLKFWDGVTLNTIAYA